MTICAICRAPATGFVNVNASAASSVPSAFEARCDAHNPSLLTPKGGAMSESHSTDAELMLRTRELDLRERELALRERELDLALRRFEAELEEQQHTAEHLEQIREMFDRVASAPLEARAVSPNSRGRA